jgi:hypothetical protein
MKTNLIEGNRVLTAAALTQPINPISVSDWAGGVVQLTAIPTRCDVVPAATNPAPAAPQVH